MGKGLSGELTLCGQVLFLFNFGFSIYIRWWWWAKTEREACKDRWEEKERQVGSGQSRPDEGEFVQKLGHLKIYSMISVV